LSQKIKTPVALPTMDIKVLDPKTETSTSQSLATVSSVTAASSDISLEIQF